MSLIHDWEFVAVDSGECFGNSGLLANPQARGLMTTGSTSGDRL